MSDDEIDAFGLPPRPKEGEARASWVKAFAGLGGQKPSQCYDPNSGSAALYTSNIWAGAISSGYGDYERADSTNATPTVSSYCANDSVTGWSGLGGFTVLSGGVQKLLQPGQAVTAVRERDRRLV